MTVYIFLSLQLLCDGFNNLWDLGKRLSGMWLKHLLSVFLLTTVFGIMAAGPAQSQCSSFPKVKIWGAISHNNVSRYVENNMMGDCEAYIDRLKAVRSQLKNIPEQGKRANIRLNNQRIKLSGDKLLEYLEMTEKRIEIVGCLAKETDKTEPGVKEIIASEPQDQKIDYEAKQKPAVSKKGNLAAGQALSVICEDCHGVKGISGDPLFPNSAGQQATYLTKQLRYMRNAARDRAGA